MATTRICSIEGCGKPHSTLGYCAMHARRVRIHGDPLYVAGTAYGAAQQFIKTASSYESNDCLPWPFSRCRAGYGRIHINGRPRVASRVVCEAVHGPPPGPGYHAAHTCGGGHNGCVNPRHIRWATTGENDADKDLHGTRPRGDSHTTSKLSSAQVLLIRSTPKTCGAVQIFARKYGVSPATIYDVLAYRTWRGL